MYGTLPLLSIIFNMNELEWVRRTDEWVSHKTDSVFLDKIKKLKVLPPARSLLASLPFLFSSFICVTFIFATFDVLLKKKFASMKNNLNFSMNLHWTCCSWHETCHITHHGQNCDVYLSLPELFSSFFENPPINISYDPTCIHPKHIMQAKSCPYNIKYRL